MKLITLALTLTIVSFKAWSDQPLAKKIDVNLNEMCQYKDAIAMSSDINKAFQRGDMKEVRRIKAKRDSLMQLVADSVFILIPDATRSIQAAHLIGTLVNYSDAMALSKYLDRFDKTIQSPTFQSALAELESVRRNAVGTKATDFNLFDKNGNEYSFRKFKDKYIFIEFSASWCGWCKKEMPYIHKAYQRFGDKVVFITVYLDDNRQKWETELKQNAVEWYALTDLKAWNSPITKAYGVRGIPHNFVISPEHVIVANGIRGEEIEEFFNMQFNLK